VSRTGCSQSVSVSQRLTKCETGAATAHPAAYVRLCDTAGTPTRIGEAKLRRAIGNPTKVVNGGCEFANEHARNLSWGSAITVVFSDINGRGQQLHGWNVRKGTATVKVSLPYGVLIGTTAAAARKAIPAAKGKWNATFQTYELTTTKAPGMYWFSDRKDGNGPVTAISLNPVFCD
jgi:hypothetical protein